MLDPPFVSYEQHPFDEERIQSLAAEPHEEDPATGWRRSPHNGFEIVSWRVVGQDWLQVLRSKSELPLMAALECICPTETAPRGEWQVSQWDSGRGYTASSKLAVTHGPYPWQSDLNDWLDAYGLRLCAEEDYVYGESYFTDMETGCFEDALNRLAWLENICMQVNWHARIAREKMWSWLDRQCRAALETNNPGRDGPMKPPPLFKLMATRTRGFDEPPDGA